MKVSMENLYVDTGLKRLRDNMSLWLWGWVGAYAAPSYCSFH